VWATSRSSSLPTIKPSRGTMGNKITPHHHPNARKGRRAPHKQRQGYEPPHSRVLHFRSRRRNSDSGDSFYQRKHRTKHHMVPRSRHGTSDVENLLTIWDGRHRAWHALFGNMTLEETIHILCRVARMKKRQNGFIKFPDWVERIEGERRQQKALTMWSVYIRTASLKKSRAGKAPLS